MRDFVYFTYTFRLLLIVSYCLLLLHSFYVYMYCAALMMMMMMIMIMIMMMMMMMVMITVGASVFRSSTCGVDFRLGRYQVNNSRQVVHTCVPLSPNSIIWYWPKGSVFMFAHRSDVCIILLLAYLLTYLPASLFYNLRIEKVFSFRLFLWLGR